MIDASVHHSSSDSAARCCLQTIANAIRHLEDVINKRCCELFYVDGVVVSIDDWKWVCGAKNLPFKQKVPKGVAWVAENAATIPHKFVLVTRKRVRDPRTRKLQPCAVTFAEVARTLATMPHDRTTITCDRGFTTYELAKKCTCLCFPET